MSETAPTVETPRSADHAELARLEAQLAKKKMELNGNEAFGKYDQIEGPLDKDGRPIAGSHADYHAQRPSDGVVRDGGVFRHAENGKFATEEDYEAQKGNLYNEGDEANAQRYYNEQLGNNEPSVETDYESMQPPQLAVEAAKANEIGDIAEMNDIRETLNIRLLNEVTRPGTEMTEKDYQDEMDRYDHLVELAIQNRKGKSGEAVVSTESAESEEPTADPTSPEAYPGANIDVAGKAVELYKGEQEPEAEVGEYSVGTEGLVDGKKVTIGDVLHGQKGDTFYQVTDSAGRTSVVTSETFHTSDGAKKPSLIDRAKALKGELLNGGEKLKALWAKKGELADNGGEKLKSAWSKVGEQAKKMARPEYWGERFTAAANGLNRLNDHALNWRVKETDTPEEADKKRNQNRVFMVAGGMAVLAAGFVAGLEIGHAVGSADGAHHAVEAASGGAGTGGQGSISPEEQAILSGGNHPASGGGGVSEQLDQHRQMAEIQAQDAQARAAEAAAAAQNASAFNISDGEGGLKLFSSLNIEPSKWFANQETLLRNFPQDFYRMNGGGVGIAHQGPLTQAAQNFINGLRG